MMEPVYLLLLLPLLILAYPVYIYNRLVGLRNMADSAYGNIDALLQKRFDLVPNLVQTVRGYMEHEKEVLEAVTRARTDWLQASTIADNAGADESGARALKSLFAVAEGYPELKANRNFLLLQEELAGIENKIAYGRQRYNRTVMALNTAVQRFPANILARHFNFQSRDYFAVTSEQARNVPFVDLKGVDQQ